MIFRDVTSGLSMLSVKGKRRKDAKFGFFFSLLVMNVYVCVTIDEV